MYAASKGHTEIVKLLIDRGANIDAVDIVSDRSLNVTLSSYYLHVLFKIVLILNMFIIHFHFKLLLV